MILMGNPYRKDFVGRIVSNWSVIFSLCLIVETHTPTPTHATISERREASYWLNQMSPPPENTRGH